MKKRYVSVMIICVVAAVLISVWWLVGNVVHNKHYDYSIAESHVDNLSIGARLLGQYEKDKKTVVYAGPYELLVWFEADNTDFGAKLNKVSFVNKKTKVVALVSLDNAVVEQEDGVVYFTFKNIKLDYLDYDLRLEYKIEGTNEPNSITLFLKRNYKEFISFRFWDKVMSV